MTITIRMSKAMLEARQKGLSFAQIARKFGVSKPTASRHCDPERAEKQRKWNREVYARNPEPTRARNRANYQKRKAIQQ